MNSATGTFAQKFGTKHGFDITMIIALITAIAKIFENCPAPTPAGAAKSPNLGQRVRATRIVMDELDGLSRREARRMANDLILAAADEDDATIEAVCSECMSGTFA